MTRRVVDLIVDEVLAAIHRHHFTGSRSHGGESDAHSLGFGFRAKFADGSLCRALGLAAEGGDNGESAALDLCLIDTECEKLLVDSVQQVSGLTAESIARLSFGDLWELSAVILGFRNPPLTEHSVEDVLPSTTKCGHVFFGVESSGIVHDRGQNRAFAQRHVLNRLVEVGHGSRFDSVGVPAEEGDV